MEEFTPGEIFEIKFALRAQATTLRSLGKGPDGITWVERTLGNVESALEKVEAVERRRIYGTDT